MDNRLTSETASLYSGYLYQNLIRSLVHRGKGRVEYLPGGNTVLSWGISTFVGGKFTEADGENFLAVFDKLSSPRFINLPDGQWTAFIREARGGKLKEKTILIYRFDPDGAAVYEEDPCVVPVTREFMEQALPGSEMLRGELYSYTDMEDFYRNGFGFALVIGGAVTGYCLSEYSLDGSHGINIGVDEPHRRKGYARKMTEAFLAQCRKTGQTAWWVCDGDNIPSNRLAVTNGFVLQGEDTYFEL